MQTCPFIKMKKEDYKVNPWNVSGIVNYDKLIKEFGVEKINPSLLKRIENIAKGSNLMLRREIFFAHRDLDFILNEYEKGNKFFLYTGRGPSGKIHLGHLLPLIFTKWLQDAFDTDLWIQFTDDEKFLFNKDLDFKQVENYMEENMIDIIALGFNPKKTKFIINTKHANLLYKEACKVAKKITFSMVKASFGMNEQTNIGSIFYTSMQAVPAFLPSIMQNKKIPCLIPHAIDQDPHFRLTRDILPKLGHYKPASIQCSFLPSLQGFAGKMSSSKEESAIYTTDSSKEVERKIKKYAFSGGRDSIEEHRKYGGNPDIDISYQYLKYLFEQDDKKLEKIYKDYKEGKLLTSELKNMLIKKINEFLKDHQRKKESAKDMIKEFIYK